MNEKSPAPAGLFVLVSLSNGVERCRLFHLVFPGVFDVQGFEIGIGQWQLERRRVLDFVEVVVQFVGVKLELVEEGGEAGAVRMRGCRRRPKKKARWRGLSSIGVTGVT